MMDAFYELTLQVKIWFQNRRSKCKKVLRQQEQRYVTASSTKDDGSGIVSEHQPTLPHQLQQQMAVGLTPPRTPHVAADSGSSEDERRRSSSASSSTSSPPAGLDTPSSGCYGYSDSWYQRSWARRHPSADTVYWASVNGGQWHWSERCPAVEFNAGQRYSDTGDCDYSSALQPSSLWSHYQHCRYSPLYT